MVRRGGSEAASSNASFAASFRGVTVAGCSLSEAHEFVNSLRCTDGAELSCAVLDINSPLFEEDLKALKPQAVVHTCGPFQGQDYQVAMACIRARAHYIDLADGRDFVAGIGALDAQARAAADRTEPGHRQGHLELLRRAHPGPCRQEGDRLAWRQGACLLCARRTQASFSS